MPRPRTAIPTADLNFAENLRHARTIRDWSYGRLAKESGIPTSALFKAETANRKVSIGEAVAISAALGFDLQVMIHGKVKFKSEVTHSYTLTDQVTVK